MVTIGSNLSLPVVLRHVVEAAVELADARYGALGVIRADGLLAEFIHVARLANGVAARMTSIFRSRKSSMATKRVGLNSTLVDGAW